MATKKILFSTYALVKGRSSVPPLR